MSEFTVEASELSEALNLALNSAEVKTTIPWLSYALIDAKDGRVRLSATDLDMSITLNVSATVKSAGSFCVKAKQLRDLVSLMPGDVFIYTTKNDQVWVETDTSDYRLPCLPAEEFQFIERAAEEKLSISGDVLTGMLQAASIAMETNPNGKDSWKNIELWADGKKLSITGMCGPRAATTSISTESEFYVLLPAKAVNALTSFAAKADEVKLFVSENVLTAQFGDDEATFKLSALKWADWRPIVEQGCEHQIEFNSEALAPALRRALLATERSRLVSRVDFELKSDGVDLYTASVEHGEGNETLPFSCPTLNGKPVKIALDGAHLLGLFKIIKGGIVWEFSENHTALRFKPQTELPFDFCYVQGTLRI